MAICFAIGGKNISGTGMDTNVVGRVLNPVWDGFSEPNTPVIKAIGNRTAKFPPESSTENAE